MEDHINAIIKQTNIISDYISLLIEAIKNMNDPSEKLDQILKIIKEENEFETFEQVNDISIPLFVACAEQNIEAIRLMIGKEITNEDGFKININSKTKTACITSFPSNQREILIPRSIQYNQTEYNITNIINLNTSNSKIKTVKFDKNPLLNNFILSSFKELQIVHISIPPHITKIGKRAFYNCVNLKSIEIPENSQLKSIGFHSFVNTSIESFFIPSGFIEFKDEWCYQTNSLKRIIISPENRNFKFTEDGLLLGKSDQNNDNFDVLIFGSRCIEKVIIPTNIKRISSCAFCDCVKLKNVEIQQNSELQIIESRAFIFCPIESLFIPSCFIEFKDYWCYQTNSLKKIIISPENRNFKFTEDGLLLGKSDQNNDNFDVLIFGSRCIEKVLIPTNIKRISSCAFCNCAKLQNVEIQPNSELDFIGELVFNGTSITQIYIPKKVTKISKNTFSQCMNLKTIQFDDCSELKCICDYSFSETSIESISIPKHVKIIKVNAFSQCKCLKTVEIPEDSELQFIEYYAFSKASIESISIPKHVQMIFDYAFVECQNLKTVEIPNDSELKLIGNLSFSETLIESIFIPKHVQIILYYAFDQCKQLNTVNFSNDSELQLIGCGAFSETLIESISIPKNVQIILDSVFIGCQNLKTVEISKDSELKLIDSSTFSETIIESIFIPKHVQVILDYAFEECIYLSMVNFSNDSELQLIGKYAFRKTSIENISIPKHVKTIDEGAFYCTYSLKEVDIPEDSELQTICKSAFYKCSIQKLFIPADFREFGKGWCSGLHYMNEFNISPKNCNFKFIKNRFLLGKSDQNKDNYDVLIYALKDLKEIKIPSKIKVIASNAFENNRNHINTAEFEENSELQLIDDEAFIRSTIEYISIPKSVTYIGKMAFKNSNLERIEIPKDSELMKCGESFIDNTNIESFYIPSHFVGLENGWCCGLNKLKKFIVSPENQIFKFDENDKILYEKSDPNTDNYDIIHFGIKDLKTVVVKSNIIKIAKFAFYMCKKLNTIVVNSNLEIIDDKSFMNSSINKIFIPNNCKLKVIGSSAFQFSNIESFAIPPSTSEMNTTAFENCNNLLIIEISDNSKLKSLDTFEKLNKVIIMVSVNLFKDI